VCSDTRDGQRDGHRSTLDGKDRAMRSLKTHGNGVAIVRMRSVEHS